MDEDHADSPERRYEQQQDQLLMLAAHELRTPITVIKGTIQLARRRLRAAGHLAEAEQLDVASDQVDRLTALLDYLLRASQIDSPLVELAVVPFNLPDLVRQVRTDMQVLSPTHTMHVTAPAQLVLDGDAERLGQVLRNLITNAIKYSPAGGRVEITVRRARQEAEVCVRDYGIGIPTAERDQVFERFHRASNVRAIPGFGLGLSMSREIVRAHHGRLWVGDLPAADAATATDGELPGSLLCLRLPLHPPVAPGVAPLATS
jgi:signal transduction histidine kinase